MYLQGSVDDKDDEGLDPRIQGELEKMNTATEEINRLEKELDLANNAFQKLLSESTEQLESLAKKLGSCIKKARPYYEALEISRKAQIECQQAAVLYQRAYENHMAAKETISLAETRFLSEKHELQFDMAWQEMLNQATIKVMEAEKSKAASEKEHKRRAAISGDAERKVQLLEKDLKRHIVKSRPYFLQKEQINRVLLDQKEKVQMLREAVAAAKRTYSQGMHNLEMISEQIHEKRAISKGHEFDRLSDVEYPPLDYDLERCEVQSYKSSYLSNATDDGDSISLASSAGGLMTPTSRNSDASSAYWSNGRDSVSDQMSKLNISGQSEIAVLPPLMFPRREKKDERRSRSDGYLGLTSNEMYQPTPSLSSNKKDESNTQ